MTRKSPDPRFGDWKFIHEIARKDLLLHPVWAWCSSLDLPDECDGPIGGDETSMRPVLDATFDFKSLYAPPMIHLNIVGSELEASALYYHNDGKIEVNGFFDGDKSFCPALAPKLPSPIRYTSTALPGITFEATPGKIDEATKTA